MKNLKPYHIVLVEPEIPPNTGNIARTCAATGTHLHLVEPLGFHIDDRTVKRAGLDYWPYVNLTVHSNFEQFLDTYKDATMYFVSTKGTRSYSDITYEEGTMFVFGRETKGLPREFLDANKERTIRIPMIMKEELRSLNLANSANIVIYEALRQQGFVGLG